MTKKIIDLISYKPKRLILINGKHRNKILLILNESFFSKEPKMIKYLLELVLQKDKLIAEKAMDCIKSIIMKISLIEWMMIENDLKSDDFDLDYLEYLPRERWHGLKSNKIDEFATEETEENILLLGLLSFHNNGYIREQALNLLDNFNTGEEIKFLLLRANDWVEKIRDLSEKAILKRLNHNNLEKYISTMPLLYSLEKCLRKDHNKLIGIIEKFINQNDYNSEKLLKYINCKDKIISRKCYKLLLNKQNHKKQDVINLGLKHKDVVIQRTAVKEIYKELKQDKSKAEYYYNILKVSKNAGVRKYAPDILAQCNTINKIREWTTYLMDTSSYVRYVSRYWLRKNNIYNFREVYIIQLNKGEKNLFASIGGLGEVGTKEDAKLLVEYVHHQRNKIKKTALQAIIKLNVKDYTDILIDCLSSDVKGISNIGRNGLEQVIHIIEDEKLWDIILGEKVFSYVLENIIYLFTKMPKWNSIIQVLRLFDIEFDNNDIRVNRMIFFWTRNSIRNFTTPTNVQISIIKELYKRNYIKLNPNNRLEIENIIKRY